MMLAVRRISFIVLALLSCFAGAGSVRAQPSQLKIFPKELEAFSSEDNETGVTVGRDLWAAARHPMRPGVISQLGQDSRRPPHKGFQIELLSPGDVGATVHFRW